MASDMKTDKALPWAKARSEISATTPDWSRECPKRLWDPGRRLLKAIRDYQRRQRGGPVGRVLAQVCVLRHRFWSTVAGADIPLDCNIGGGLLLPHPNGVVVHPSAAIGPNCLFFQQTTIGTAKGPEVPTIGGHVDVGAGAKVLGGIHVGDHAKIGANAVVLCDVPAYATAVGNPARIIPPPHETGGALAMEA